MGIPNMGLIKLMYASLHLPVFYYKQLSGRTYATYELRTKHESVFANDLQKQYQFEILKTRYAVSTLLVQTNYIPLPMDHPKVRSHRKYDNEMITSTDDNQ